MRYTLYVLFCIAMFGFGMWVADPLNRPKVSDDTELIALSKAMERTTMETLGTHVDRFWDHDTGVVCYERNGRPLGCALTPTTAIESIEREACARKSNETVWRWSSPNNATDETLTAR